MKNTKLFLLSIINSFIAHENINISYDYLYKLLPHNPTIIEAGASHGEDTEALALKWPKGQIFAFEPLPKSYKKLVKKVKNRTNVHTFPLALSDSIGKNEFYEVLTHDESSSLLFPQYHQNFSALKKHIVNVTTIDSWCKEHNLNKIDFLWLDMEGGELNALKGALQILPSVSFVYLEINFERFWKDACLYEEVKTWLSDHGFSEIWIKCIPNEQGNALFKQNEK